MRYLLILVNVLLVSSLQAQNIEMRISYGRFFPTEKESLLETYFAFKGSTLELKPNDDGVLQGGIEVRITFYQDEEIIGMDNFRVQTPAGIDKEELSEFFTHTQRLRIDTGIYDVHLTVVDMHNQDEKYDFEFAVDLTGPDKVGFSDVNILSSYSKSAEGSPTAIGGFEMIPLIPRKDFYFGPSSGRVSFYAELYDRTSDGDSARPFMLKYYIERAEQSGAIQKLAGFKRIDTNSGTIPMLSSFSISDLPSGHYFLVLEVVSQKNEVMDSRNVYFYRHNPDKDEPLPHEKVESSQLAGTFVEQHINKDSLVHFVDFLYPIADFQERRAIESLTDEEDEHNMKRFFYTFWAKRHPLEAYEKWLEYYAEVRHVNKVYGVRVLPGYQSDRGRIYLQYGPPTLVEDRRFETGTYPFEIWQYDQLKSPTTRDQVDRIFVFVDREVNTNRYRLVHSTAQGERYNEFWTRELEVGSQIGERYEDDEMARYQRDRGRRGDWGSRATDNLIINPSTMGRYGRW
jgi:GWxTD domain-containing protein